MIKWFKSLSKQEKVMAILIVMLLIGVILRWDNIRKKALIWFRYDDIMEQRADSVEADQNTMTVEEAEVITDTLFNSTTRAE